jgi:hypothetical protein
MGARANALLVWSLVVPSLAACGGGGGGANAANAYDAASQTCVDHLNQLRATLSLPPYARWTDEEVCAAGEAESDSTSGTAHGAFGTCMEHAQDECPGWPGPPGTMITSCLDMMWAEGPGPFNQGHGHYDNMSSTMYSKVACGFYVLGNGSVWAAQNFQ